MLEKNHLNFHRRDVFSAADDDVLGSIDDNKVSIWIDRSEVSRVEPAIPNDRLSCLRVFPVPLHHDVAAYYDLTDRASVPGDILSVIVDYPKIHAHDRKPLRSLPLNALLLGPVHTRLIDGDSEDG
jgi:hypothetical protein